MTNTLTIRGGKTLRADTETPLAGALRRAGVAFAMPCGGTGACGKCALWIAGPTDGMGDVERDLLSRLMPMDPPAPGFARRLACYCRLRGDCEAIVSRDDASVLTRGDLLLPAYDGEEDGALGFAVDIGTTTVVLTLYDLPRGTQLAVRCGANRQAAFGADVLSRIAYTDAHGPDAPHRAIAEQLNELLADALREAGLMLARDDAEARVWASSRDLAGSRSPADSAEANTPARERNSVGNRVLRGVITGNTTMLHLLTGLNPHGIGVSPFTPESLFGEERRADALFPRLPGDTPVYLPRCVGAYVGADITCGMLAAGIARPGGTRLLIDVGTNGEMALFADGALLCCATAAGPAFEGATIEMGMAAAEGAICRVSLAAGDLRIETIGGVSARGICGTGLISAVRALLTCGALDETGALQADSHPLADLMETRDNMSPAVGSQGLPATEGVPEKIPAAVHLGDSGVLLTARDIREVQLAKAAIAAGIDTLLHEAGMTAEAVDEVCLAGGFGSAIDPEDAAAIGLIPRALTHKTRAAGNLALSGAAMMLLSRAARAEAAALAVRAREIPLGTNAFFMEKYIDHMQFPEG